MCHVSHSLDFSQCRASTLFPASSCTSFVLLQLLFNCGERLRASIQSRLASLSHFLCSHYVLLAAIVGISTVG